MGLGTLFIISTQQLLTIEQVDILKLTIQQVQNNVEIGLIVALVFLAVVLVVLSIFLSKYVIYPINKLIKSAAKIAIVENNNSSKIKKTK